MSAGNIVLIAVLAVLLLVCFLSGKIAGKMGGADEQTLQKRSLLIKLAAAAAGLVIYLIVFLK